MEEHSLRPACGAPERELECLIFEACHSCRSLYSVPKRVLDSPFFCEASTGICVWCLANCSAEELHELNRSRKLMRLNLDSLCANLKQRAKVRLDDLRTLKQQLAANASATADTRRSFEEAIERAKTTANRSEVGAHAVMCMVCDALTTCERTWVWLQACCRRFSMLL